ncbi:MAG: hypothetical protein AAB847_00100 [Patescibacteria group bacterium]
MTTIIRPNKNKYPINLTIILLSIGLLTMVGTGVLLYNQIVNLQHFINSQSESLEVAKLTNIDYKNRLYQLIDSKNLIVLANQLGMIKVNNPEFLVP